MNSKKYVIISVAVVVVLGLIVLSWSTIKKELGIGSRAGINFNSLSVSEDEIDADLKAIAENKPLNELLKESADPLVKDGKVTPVYRASWANIKMRTLAIKEIRQKENMKVTKKDKDDALKDAQELFTGSDQESTDEIWEAFPKSFRDRLVNSFAEQYALLRAADKPTEKEIKEYFEKNQETIAAPCESGKTISHILVATEEEAKKVQSSLNAGEEFEKLAEAKSTDPGSKDKGGDLGCFIPGNFVAEFEAAATTLTPGNMSGIVKTDFGYHILRAEEFTAPTLEDARDQIITQLETEKQSEVFDQVQKGLEKAKVKVLRKYGRVVVEEKIPAIVPLKEDVPESTTTTTPGSIDTSSTVPST